MGIEEGGDSMPWAPLPGLPAQVLKAGDWLCTKEQRSLVLCSVQKIQSCGEWVARLVQGIAMC
jgi:hypothetical protein